MIDSNNDFIHTFQLNDTNICDELITYFHNNNEYKNHGKVGEGEIKPHIKDSLDVIIHPSSTNKTIQNYYKNLQVGLTDYVHKFKMQNCRIHTIEPMNIQYYKPGGGYPRPHTERMSLGTSHRLLAFMTYLTDTKNAGTRWEYLDWEAPCKKGLTLIWPVDHIYLHNGIISNSEEKMIITGWLGFNK